MHVPVDPTVKSEVTLATQPKLDLTRWFSEKFSHADFCTLDIPVAREMQKDIACYETLAQIAILKIAATEFTVGRIPRRIPSVSDNTSAEAGKSSFLHSPSTVIISGKVIIASFQVLYGSRHFSYRRPR